MSTPAFNAPTTAFYFANRNNETRANKPSGKAVFYGPFETEAEALHFSSFHTNNKVADLVVEFDEEQIADLTSAGVLFHHFEKAGYFHTDPTVIPFKEEYLSVKLVKAALRIELGLVA